MTHVVVIDTSLRQASIKVTPGTYFADILEEACIKFGLESTLYGLKKNNKFLDLCCTFRQSGLSSGARIELVLVSRSPLPVSVALQLPEIYLSIAPNGRLMDKFSNDTTIWLILRKFETKAGTNVNFTARGVRQYDETAPGHSEKLFYEMPVLNIMGRKLSKFDEFQKTLRQLGFIKGTCLIKLDFCKTSQPYEEATLHIQDYFRPEFLENSEKDLYDPSCSREKLTIAEDSSSNTSKVGSKRQNSVTTEDTPQKISIPASISEYKPGISENLRPNIYQSHAIKIYAPPSSQIPKAATIPHNEADFEPTIEHAKLHQSRLQSNSLNKRLLSDAELEQIDKERAVKFSSTSEISIKIRFPDESSVVFSFDAEKTGQNLYEFVTGLIEDEQRSFNLIWHNSGPQVIPRNDKKLVKDLRFQTRMLVNFSWNEGVKSSTMRAPTLKPMFAEQAEEISLHMTQYDSPDDSKPYEKVDFNTKDKKSKGVGKWFKGFVK